jgi:cell division protease FtsH
MAKSVLLQRLERHFRNDPATLPVVEQHFAVYERPNLHLAIEELIRSMDAHFELTGIVSYEEYNRASLARLSRKGSAKHFDRGPVEYVDVALHGDQRLACVKNGLYLFHDERQPLALLLEQEQHWSQNLLVEVMAPDRELAERFSRQLTRRTRHGTAFRGHVLSLEEDCHRQLTVRFHQLPAIRRDELVLPEELLARIERHTLSFSRHAEKLRAANRHLKRGILLYGPPGTGKTLTAMYLVSQMPARSVLLLTGAGMGSIEAACNLARMLAPATVVLEDVDLIGTERHMQTVGANALLFELLNQMDGLADDTDILFVLTTNRPDILEPALAARPGRIDQAIKVPPPDTDCRRRLLELYSRGLQLELKDPGRIIERMDGVSGAFIRELLRKAAVFAAEDDGEAPLVVQDRHIEEALGELLVAGGPLTQSLLGAAPTDVPAAPPVPG